jgi:hypothetical protein
MLIGLILIVVVAFFAWQWWTAAGRKTLGGTGGRKTGAALVGTAGIGNVGSGGPSANAAGAAPAPLTTAPPKEERFPEVAGQSEAELRAKEPVQSRAPVVSEMPVTVDNLGPPTIPDTLRHPEQSFHQPAPHAPTMSVSDVPAGRAGTPGLAVAPAAAGGAQMFAPEMAQNGGPLIGGSVFAFDGMEPTGFAAF